MVKRKRSREESGHVGPSIDQVATPCPAVGKLLKRTEVAERLGVSVAKVRRMEGKTLTPIVENGVHFFAEEEIQAVFVRVRRTVASDAAPVDLEAIVASFTLFEQQTNPADVVKCLRLEPERVEELYRSWRAFRNTRVVPAADVAELRRLLPGAAFETEQELVQAVQRELGGCADRCRVCRRARAYYCPECAKAALKAARIQHSSEELSDNE